MSGAEDLAERIRVEIGGLPGVAEIRMMGGQCFTLHGNMVVAVMKNGDLLARVGADGYEAAQQRPGADAMLMGGREMKGFVNVDAAVLDDDTLKDWLSTSLTFVGPMPPKAAKEKKPVKPKARRA
jgi:TfoX/Sxy family transcriptional regulator of competence genes